ncbi:MAG: hypothetical protein QOG14_3155 [Mycobacterium sp.]|jgi:hypothetical protein|nr:hypothetical protein [Mycobacterium sp.]
MLESTRELTAYHEAGHAVAVLMRGGGQLHSIDIGETADYRGYTHFSAKVFDTAFITFAGPFAEARALWPLDDLDGEDENGKTFDDYVRDAFNANAVGDFEAYPAALNADPTTLASFQSRREETWKQELKREWHVIEVVARRLLTIGADMYHGPDHRTWHDTIQQLLGVHADGE